MITARPSVVWDDAKEEGPKRYTLLVALPAPYHAVQSDHTRWNFPATAAAVLDTKSNGPLPPNLPVVVQLWVWRNADHGEPCQYRAAHAVSTLKVIAAGGLLELKNVKGQTQAWLTLSDVQSTVQLEPQPSAKWGLHRIVSPPPMTVREMLGGVDVVGNGRVPRAFLRDHVEHTFGDLPVWMTCLLYGETVAATVTEGYLRNALYHSIRLIGFTGESEWAMGIGKDDPRAWEVLAKVCMFNTQARPYLFDKTRKRGKGLVGSDQFSVVESAPDAAGAAGDCEDDALSISRVAQALHEMRFNDYPQSDPFHHLVKMAHGYCCFTADVSINPEGHKMPENECDDDPSQLSLHHLTMLVPWSTVAELLGSKAAALNLRAEAVRRTAGWPVLSLEGTEPSRGNPLADTRSVEAFADACRSLRRGPLSNPATKPMSRGMNDATYRIFVEAKFYRQLIALYSADLFRLCGVAMLLPCEGGKHGARYRSWVTARSQDVAARGLSMTVTKFATRREANVVARLTRWLPKLMPLAMTGKRETWRVRGGSGAMFVMWREVDLSEPERKAIVKAFRAVGKWAYAGQHRITVTDGFAVLVLRFL